MNENQTQRVPFDLSGLNWIHADVFTRTPLSGNGLVIFPNAAELSSTMMQRLTQEMRQFESVFVIGDPGGGRVDARIFTTEEELDFAGHPVLGAAAALQYLTGAKEEHIWRIVLNTGEVSVRTQTRPHGFWTEMDQGVASFEQDPSPEDVAQILDGLGLVPDLLVIDLPVATVSTGLPYVIVPVTESGLSLAKIHCADFGRRLERLGGKFVYILNPETLEGRTWDNQGMVEDIATGSAAGPAAAYLWRHCEVAENIVLRQGRFVERPSEIAVKRHPKSGSVLVSGDVVLVATGQFL